MHICVPWAPLCPRIQSHPAVSLLLWTSLFPSRQPSLQSVQLGQILLEKFGARVEKQSSLVVHPGCSIVSLHTPGSRLLTGQQQNQPQKTNDWLWLYILHNLCGETVFPRTQFRALTGKCDVFNEGDVWLLLPSCAEFLPCSSRPETGLVSAPRPAGSSGKSKTGPEFSPEHHNLNFIGVMGFSFLLSFFQKVQEGKCIWMSC